MWKLIIVIQQFDPLGHSERFLIIVKRYAVSVTQNNLYIVQKHCDSDAKKFNFQSPVPQGGVTNKYDPAVDRELRAADFDNLYWGRLDGCI